MSQFPQHKARKRFGQNFLHDAGVIDRIIPEPVGGAQRMPATAIAAVGKDIAAMLKDLAGRKPADLIRDRRQKFLSMGASSLA